MDMTSLEPKLKELAKSVGTILVLGLAVTLATYFVDAVAAHGIILGVLAGAYGYQPLRAQVSKLKGLQ